MSDKPTFLYVEDDPNSREVMKLIMANVLDYPLTVFEDSYDFLEKFRALPQRPDVIFLDIHMLPIDGFELLKLIRAEPGGDTYIIIAMTASVMAIDVEQFREVGFDGMVGKPIRNRIFPELLEKILKRESIWFIS